MSNGTTTIEDLRVPANGIDVGRAGETPSLSEEEVHTVLSNSRRRRALEQLRENGGELTARELSERIAAVESGESPPPRSTRQSVYVSLHQTHLPKLDDLGIVQYDTQSKTVTLRDAVDQITAYMDSAPGDEAETAPGSQRGWGELHAGIGLLGLLAVAGADVGVWPLATLLPHYWAYVVLALGVVVAALQANR